MKGSSSMGAEIINGKILAKQLRETMKQEVSDLKSKGLIPHLTVILVGDDPASRSYVNGKRKASSEIGISSEIIELPKSTEEEALLEEIERLNNNPSVHGILVQLPLPEQINEHRVIEAIHPAK